MRDQLHAEDGLGRGIGVIERLGHLHAAAFAAAAGVDLCLDHDDRVARREELLGRVIGLFERGHHLALRHGNAVLTQDVLRLVLVNLHRGSKLRL